MGVASWFSVMGIRRIKHANRRNLSLAEMVSLPPVRLPIIALTAAIGFFILPFHSVEVYVRDPDGSPLAGVMAKVDGDTRPNASNAQGRLSIGGLLACAHSIQLEKTGYRPRVFRAHFTDVLAVGRLHPAPLERAEGTVTVRSDPPGAAIYVDCETEERGLAGTAIRLPVGTHVIMLKLPGYEAWAEKVTVDAERSTEPGTRKLRRELTQPEAMDHFQRAEALAVQKDWGGAIYEYRKAIRLKSDNPYFHGRLADALSWKQDWGGEATEAREALRLNPCDGLTHLRLGQALMGMGGQLDGAIAELREAVRLNPNYAFAHAELGWALENRGLRREALEEYRRANQLDPNDADAKSKYERLSKQLITSQ